MEKVDLKHEYVPALVVISAVGLIFNAVSLSFFVKMRKEFGNTLLAYMNIVDIIMSISTVLYYVVAPQIPDVLMMLGLKTISFHICRSSIMVTGLITIYLNILRTTAIIWPLIRIKRGPLHASLIILMAVFVGLEASFGVFWTYPNFAYEYKVKMGVNVSPPLVQDHPFVQFYLLELQIFGIPIVILVTVCCIASAGKLLMPNPTLVEIEDNGARVKAATTVLLLGVQYVVCNTVGLILYTIYGAHILHGDNLSYGLKLYFIGSISLALNSTLNPVVYIWRLEKLREHVVNTWLTCHVVNMSRG